eukprot:GHVP01064667.1.p2 GENE.GHVP01064667.1~~GHVP01064667.1.p2  ORF type:complete len:673 (-),score=139.97 GHVP01064667.1:275-2293(-)
MKAVEGKLREVLKCLKNAVKDVALIDELGEEVKHLGEGSKFTTFWEGILGNTLRILETHNWQCASIGIQSLLVIQNQCPQTLGLKESAILVELLEFLVSEVQKSPQLLSNVDFTLFLKDVGTYIRSSVESDVIASSFTWKKSNESTHFRRFLAAILGCSSFAPPRNSTFSTPRVHCYVAHTLVTAGRTFADSFSLIIHYLNESDPSSRKSEEDALIHDPLYQSSMNAVVQYIIDPVDYVLQCSLGETLWRACKRADASALPNFLVKFSENWKTGVEEIKQICPETFDGSFRSLMASRNTHSKSSLFSMGKFPYSASVLGKNTSSVVYNGLAQCDFGKFSLFASCDQESSQENSGLSYAEIPYWGCSIKVDDSGIKFALDSENVDEILQHWNMEALSTLYESQETSSQQVMESPVVFKLEIPRKDLKELLTFLEAQGSLDKSMLLPSALAIVGCSQDGNFTGNVKTSFATTKDLQATPRKVVTEQELESSVKPILKKSSIASTKDCNILAEEENSVKTNRRVSFSKSMDVCEMPENEPPSQISSNKNRVVPCEGTTTPVCRSETDDGNDKSQKSELFGKKKGRRVEANIPPSLDFKIKEEPNSQQNKDEGDNELNKKSGVVEKEDILIHAQSAVCNNAADDPDVPNDENSKPQESLQEKKKTKPEKATARQRI